MVVAAGKEGQEGSSTAAVIVAVNGGVISAMLEWKRENVKLRVQSRITSVIVIVFFK